MWISHTAALPLVSRSHSLSKRERVWSCLASTTCALLPESGNTNRIAEQPIIAFPAYVTSRHSGMCNAGTNEKWRSEQTICLKKLVRWAILALGTNRGTEVAVNYL